PDRDRSAAGATTGTRPDAGPEAPVEAEAAVAGQRVASPRPMPRSKAEPRHTPAKVHHRRGGASITRWTQSGRSAGGGGGGVWSKTSWAALSTTVTSTRAIPWP